MQCLILLFSFKILSLQVPALSEIVEYSEGAAHVNILNVEPYPGNRIEGELITVEIVENLWGDPPVSLQLWSPISACGNQISGPDLIVGYKKCKENRRQYMGIPPQVYLLCGAITAEKGLCSTLVNLKQSKNWKDLVGLLKNKNINVRRECFRKLKKSCLNKETASSKLLDNLISKATEESDHEMIHNYLGTFRFFKNKKAMPFVFKILTNNTNKLVAADAEAAFQELAGAEEVSRLAELYYSQNKAGKKRILRALAPRKETAAKRLISKALKNEKNVLPILEALHAAGKPLPGNLAGIKDTNLSRRITIFLKRSHRKRTIRIHHDIIRERKRSE